MSEPENTPTIYNAITQTMGVTSSLHCPPDPIDNPHPDAMFLDEFDSWAYHASKHGSAATQALFEIERRITALKDQILFSQMHNKPMSLGFIYEELKSILGRG